MRIHRQPEWLRTIWRTTPGIVSDSPARRSSRRTELLGGPKLFDGTIAPREEPLSQLLDFFGIFALGISDLRGNPAGLQSDDVSCSSAA